MSSLHFYVRTAFSHKNLNLKSYFLLPSSVHLSLYVVRTLLSLVYIGKKLMFVRRFSREQRKLPEKKNEIGYRKLNERF